MEYLNKKTSEEKLQKCFWSILAYIILISLILNICLINFKAQNTFQRTNSEVLVSGNNIDYNFLLAGHKIFASQNNPYDVPIQTKFPQNKLVTLYFVSPPWLHIAMSPWFLINDFDTSSKIWGCSTPILLIFSICIISYMIKGNIEYDPKPYILGLLSVPFLTLIAYWNISPYLLFCSTISSLLFYKKYRLLSGFFIFPLLSKPHLIFAFSFFGILYLYRKKTLEPIIGLLITTICFSLCIEYIHPGAFKEWLYGFGRTNTHAKLNYGINLLAIVRLIFKRLDDYNLYLTLISPILLVGLTYTITNKFKFLFKQESWHLIAFIFLISPYLAPYSWIHDYCLSLLPLFALYFLNHAYKQKISIVLIISIMLNFSVSMIEFAILGEESIYTDICHHFIVFYYAYSFLKIIGTPKLASIK